MEQIVSLPMGQVKSALSSCFDAGVNVILIGPPGCAKTQMAQQVAAETNRLYTEMLLAGRDVGDVFMPFVSDGKLNFYYNDCLPIKGSKYDGIPTVLNIDEFAGAKPVMQNMLLKVLDERKIGEAKLADDVVLMATGNRAFDLAHVEQISAALANRASFITVEPELDAWIDYGVAKGFNPKTLAWVKFDPTYLFSFNPEQFLAGDMAFCSPRSNERLAKIQDLYDAGKLNDDIFRNLVCGTIGAQVGIKYTGFVRFHGQMPDMAALLNGDRVNVPTTPDVIYAVIFSIVQRVQRENIGNAIKYIKRLSPEWHQMFSSTLVVAKPQLAATSEFGAFAAEVANS
jgi:hypothetical protein